MFQFLGRNSVCSDLCGEGDLLAALSFQFLGRNSVCSDVPQPISPADSRQRFNSSVGIRCVLTRAEQKGKETK